MIEEDPDTFYDEYFEFRKKGFFVRPPGRVIDINTFPENGNEFIYHSKLKDALIEFPAVTSSRSSRVVEISEVHEPEERFQLENMEIVNDSGDELGEPVDQDSIFADLISNVPVDNRFFQWMDKSSLQFPRYAGITSANASEFTSEDNEVWIRIAAKEFAEFANALKCKREFLEERYPCKKFPDVEDEKRCCIFCLGSKAFTAIYNESSVKREANLPLLNYVLHLSQKEVISLLKHSFKWFLTIGMTEMLGKWVCALFACLKKPLSNNQVAFLEVFYDACKEYVNTSEGDDLVRLHFISSVLLHYFCVKAYKTKYQGKSTK